MDSEIEAQLGRKIKNTATVVCACHLDLPIVVANDGTTEDGRPFPTRFWLSCPLAVRSISRLETSGAVQQLNKRLESDVEFSAQVDRAHDDHDDLIHAKDRRGIGGTRSSIKCLHAHAAFQLAGGQSPAGEWALAKIGEIECESPCVRRQLDDPEQFEKNPDWKPKG